MNSSNLGEFLQHFVDILLAPVGLICYNSHHHALLVEYEERVEFLSLQGLYQSAMSIATEHKVGVGNDYRAQNAGVFVELHLQMLRAVVEHNAMSMRP